MTATIRKSIAKTLSLAPRALLVAMMLAVPVLAVPSMAGSNDSVIEAQSSNQTGIGFVLLVSLQRR